MKTPKSERQDSEIRSVLKQLLGRSELSLSGVDILSYEEVNQWPGQALELFSASGLLQPGSPATALHCPECSDEIAGVEVVASSIPGSPSRIFALCTEPGWVKRVPISPKILKRWKIDLGAFARHLSDLLETERVAEEIIQEKVWSLGIREIVGRRHEIFLIRGTSWPDGLELLRRIPKKMPCILLTLGETEENLIDSWLPLEKLILLRHGKFQIDLDLLESAASKRMDGLGGTLNFFRREGDVWKIGYQGKLFQLKDSRGLEYLLRLIQSPEKEFSPFDFLPEAPEGFTSKDSDSIFADGLSLKKRKGEPIIDQEARRQYRQRLQELKEEIEEAERNNDKGTIARLNDEEEKVQKHLLTSIRHKEPQIKRASDAISKAIHRSLANIEKHHPSLFHHLQTSLKTGSSFLYRPPNPIKWI